MNRSRSWSVWPVLVVLTLLVIGGCGLLGFTTCNPPDRVRVDVVDIPPGTHFLSLAAVNDRGAVSMPWSPTAEVGPPLEMHPKDCVWSYRHEWDPSHFDWDASARWRFGNKYGVVMQTNKGEWQVAWYPASEVPLTGRNILGGGKAEFYLSKAEIIPLDADTVKALGLQDVKPRK